jgi:NTE family protein
VLVVDAREFELIATEFPVVYRNVGAILSDRLARTNRLAAREGPGRIVYVRDGVGAPLVAYALAASIAWHTRAGTLLVVDADRGVSGELLTFLGAKPEGEAIRRAGADVLACPPDLRTATVDQLSVREYESILVHLRADAPDPPKDARVVDVGERLTGLPDFGDADLEALQDGLLPNSTPAGRAIGRVARSLCGLSVGVALGAGSVRGFSHWGVLRAFEKLGLQADYVAGTSVGGSVGALYALGRDVESGIDTLVRTGPHLVRYGFPRKGLLSNRSVSRFIHNELGEALIEDLPTPLALVAADILTQEEVVFRSGLLWQAVVASLSIPGVYPALWIGKHLVVDGGVLNPVPVSVAAEMGAGVVLAVKLVGEEIPYREVESVVAKGTPPSALAVIMRSIELMQGRIVSEAPGARTITITPEFTDLPTNKLKGFSDGARFVDRGEEAAERALPRITAALPWLRT